ncbi:hypothetical protein Nans01_34020 [Nocardiopsis ansamitocini]|uniref:YdbS-like PH domain-containing protein n=2 Tax=Nocardiopsis ansamitocini TaxID=1670832 RepID=A0A9W6UHN3_9ACTN|nr:PH domain-containing protein [Nocardiopsis ansamitocini]GLU49051.1 hypothetical protein Nans01_34020 [Nocardiopsis ansamitocini]
MWTVRSAIGVLFMLALIGGASWAVGFFAWSWVPAPVVDHVWALPALYACYGVAKTIIAPRWRYRVHRWEVTADVVYTRVGWLSRSWQLVPVGRIQTVDHTQGWLERMFRLATLEVQTASHAGSSTIEGLEEPEAQRISEELAARAGDLRDDAT